MSVRMSLVFQLILLTPSIALSEEAQVASELRVNLSETSIRLGYTGLP